MFLKLFPIGWSELIVPPYTHTICWASADMLDWLESIESKQSNALIGAHSHNVYAFLGESTYKNGFLTVVTTY